jgi:hypothetical protein
MVPAMQTSTVMAKSSYALILRGAEAVMLSLALARLRKSSHADGLETVEHCQKNFRGCPQPFDPEASMVQSPGTLSPLGGCRSAVTTQGVGVNVGSGVFVGVAVGVDVGVLVGVLVGVGVSVGVAVGVFVGVAVGVLVGVAVGVSVGVAVGVLVGVAVGVSVGADVGVLVGVAVASGVLVGLGVWVGLGVLVGLGVWVGFGAATTGRNDSDAPRVKRSANTSRIAQPRFDLNGFIVNLCLEPPGRWHHPSLE